MPRPAFRSCASAIAFLLLSGAAHAQVTADEVWDNWRGFYGSMGQSATIGAETRSGDRLTITDAVFTSADPDAVITSRFGQITFRETGAGTVEITLSPTFTVRMESTPQASDQVELDLTFLNEGLKIVAMQAEDGLRYEAAADSISVAVDRFVAEGEDTVVTGGARIEDLTGSYLIGDPGEGRFQSAFEAARLRADVTAESAENRARMSLSATIADLVGKSRARMLSALIEQADARKAPKGLPKGFALEGEYNSGRGEFAFDFSNAEGATQSAITVAESRVSMLFDTDTLRYDVASGETSFKASGAAVPVGEFAMNFDASQVGVTMPVDATDAARDLSSVIRLEGLELGPDVWAMFDPGNALPRDPATLVLDVSGKARWRVDPFNPAAMAGFEGALPLELQTLDLNALRLSALGADLKGSGGFVFDNDDLLSYDGFPKPVGQINLSLDGANALIDKLTGLGLLPQSQAMNARMMLGLFARPVQGPDAGPDNLTSTIEMREDGTVYANDQRLK